MGCYQSVAGNSLESITLAVASINDMNAQIASAAEEQSEELAQLAAQLQGMVQQFRT